VTASAALRILVVDDDPETADALAECLRLSGHEVRSVYNGRFAIGEARRFEANAILMDIGMPGLNGLDAARELREQTWHSPLMLVAISGLRRPEDVKRALEAGYDHHFAKPVDLEALRAVLDEYPKPSPP
jgi:CheY-like chemotaxis protein